MSTWPIRNWPAPAGWRVTRLVDIVSLTNGYPFRSEDFGPTGDIPLVRIRDLLGSEFEAYVSGPVPPEVIVNDGDVLIGMDGDFNVVRWTRGKAALNQRLCMLRPRRNVDIRFVAYALPAVLRVVNDLTFSTTVKHLSSTDLLGERIALPPLEEQRRIADFLDAETARIIRIANIRNATLSLAIEREQVLLDGAIEMLLKTHGAISFRRVITRIEQGVSPLCDNVEADEGEWGVLKVSAVKNRAFHPAENKRLPYDSAPDRRFEIRHGDLLITRANTPQLVGSTAVAINPRKRLLLCDKIFRVEVSNGFSKEFIVDVSRTSRIRALCAEASHGSSASMANLKVGEIKEWPIPNAPLAIQVNTVRKIESASQTVNALRAATQRQLALLDERKQALITAAVTGQFDVTTGRGVELS